MRLAERVVVYRLQARWGCAWLAALLCACERQAAWEDSPPCGTSVLRGELAVTGVTPVDLLLVVSDAPSMVEEQAALARELPALARALVTGELGPDLIRGEALRDVHVGVVSADLGLDGGSALAGCSALGGDAVLRAPGGQGDCAALPAFLRYRVPTPQRHPLIAAPDNAPADALARQVGCLAPLGSAGCGVAQPLEAALHGLWPSGLTADLASAPEPTFARAPQGQRANSGFARNDPAAGLSVLQILLISDGDDCSAAKPGELAQTAQNATDVAATCAQRGDLLHGLERYVRGLRGLRPGNEDLVLLGAITGIPEDFAPLDGNEPDPLREERFAQLLADPRMQPTASAGGALQPVCESEQSRATPAPRIVGAVRAFGRNAALHSICKPDWRSVLLPLFEATSSNLYSGVACLPRRPPRAADGRVQCTVLWELPAAQRARAGTPTACSDLPFLREHSAAPRTEEGGARCEVQQLAVTGLPGAPVLEPGAGWFFDDFTRANVDCSCARSTCNSIFFAPDRPPPQVRIAVECLDTQCWSRDGTPCDPLDCRVP